MHWLVRLCRTRPFVRRGCLRVVQEAQRSTHRRERFTFRRETWQSGCGRKRNREPQHRSHQRRRGNLAAKRTTKPSEKRYVAQDLARLSHKPIRTSWCTTSFGKMPRITKNCAIYGWLDAGTLHQSLSKLMKPNVHVSGALRTETLFNQKTWRYFLKPLGFFERHLHAEPTISSSERVALNVGFWLHSSSLTFRHIFKQTQ
jgi:hypothetical protein